MCISTILYTVYVFENLHYRCADQKQNIEHEIKLHTVLLHVSFTDLLILHTCIDSIFTAQDFTFSKNDEILFQCSVLIHIGR